MRFDHRVEVVAEDWLNLSGDLQRNSRPPCNINRYMCAFDRSDPPQEAEIVFLLCLQPVLGHVDTVMDRRDCECGMTGSLMFADRCVVDLRIAFVHARQCSLMWMMQSADEGCEYESGIGDRRRTIDM